MGNFGDPLWLDCPCQGVETGLCLSRCLPYIERSLLVGFGQPASAAASIVGRIRLEATVASACYQQQTLSSRTYRICCHHEAASQLYDQNRDCRWPLQGDPD